jgi:hypothetical protein
MSNRELLADFLSHSCIIHIKDRAADILFAEYPSTRGEGGKRMLEIISLRSWRANGKRVKETCESSPRFACSSHSILASFRITQPQRNSTRRSDDDVKIAKFKE